MGLRFSAILGILLCSLSGCVGGSFGNHEDFEMFPLRAASDAEGKSLKHCLKFVHRAQENYKKKTGHYARKPRELEIDGECQGFLMAEQGTPTGYEVRAELREDETTVRWSVNEQGVIEEHLDGNDSEGDQDLVL